MARPIPAIVSIDVEPDGFQPDEQGASAASGYDAMIDVVRQVRPRLEAATGQRVSFGWFFRMDPQIGFGFGLQDHLVTGYGDRVAELVQDGDHIGLHTHLTRWSAAEDAWVHDVTDPGWIREVYESSFDTFEQCFGRPCERHRGGAALYNQAIVDALEAVGAKVDSALEPVRGWGVDGTGVLTGVDISPLVGQNSDCSTAPRRPYWPAPGEFRRPTRKPGALALVPVTTTWLSPRQPAWRTLAGEVLKRRQRPRARMLYPTAERAPAQFWDAVARQLRFMRRPYVNIGIRTDAPGSQQFTRARAVLEALPEHPVASRLVVVDPLEALPHLVGGARPGAPRVRAQVS